jgi:hypothetical protein
MLAPSELRYPEISDGVPGNPKLAMVDDWRSDQPTNDVLHLKPVLSSDCLKLSDYLKSSNCERRACLLRVHVNSMNCAFVLGDLTCYCLCYYNSGLNLI